MAVSSQSSSTASHLNVLLLEEYDALAVAIASALTKFAPQHKVLVARSVGDAEKLATKSDPELFVIDVDPPWPGLTEFLDKMRPAHPEARVLVIGSAIPPEIAAERGSFGALQFIAKPFELAAFGAAVQALLGPWREAESASSRGNLGALDQIDVILLHCAARASVILESRANDKRSGTIHLTEGNVSHAETDSLNGIEGLREILGWSDARITEAKATLCTKSTIHRNWVTGFVEALRHVKEKQSPKISPADTVSAKKMQPKTGKKIVVIDDTEMLLIFVEDVLTRADPELQIATALTGADGIKEIERVLPDLVLLDYSLPDIDGDEVCQRLLQNERKAHIPVLMMSGHVAEMNATAQRFENVVATIEKPFLSEALVQLVQKTLAGGPRKPRVIPTSATSPVAEPLPPRKRAQRLAEERPAAPETTPVAPPPALAVFEPPHVTAAIRPTFRAVAGEANDAVLGLLLEVVSMQLTPHLRMGAIRARPVSFSVSLHLSSAVRGGVARDMGFQLGATDLDQNGRISILRLSPTAKPFQPAQTRSAFEIGGVAVVSNEARGQVQFAPAGTTPMTMQLVAHVQLEAVELSPTFQVSQLVLKWRTNAVSVTLNSRTAEQTDAAFEVASVKLDGSSRIAEILLSPSR